MVGGARVHDRAVHRLRDRAFALMDVLVAGVVLAIALAALIGLVGQSLASQLRSERLATATMLADELLGLALIEGPEVYPRQHPLLGRFDPPYEPFTFEMQFETPSAGEAYLVTATVTWEQGGDRQVRLQTLLAPRLGDEDPTDRVPETPVIRY